jgi:regulator of protease activity HflC (stomatin/prohibitin superfamily)
MPARTLAKKVLMVKKGELYISQLTEDGTTLLLQSGIHILPVLGAETKQFSTNDDSISFGTLSILRVRPGIVGLATDNGRPVFLLPGLHVYDRPNPLQFGGSKSLKDAIIANGRLNVVRVNPGQVGTSTINGTTVLLEQGTHFINDATFQMDARGGFRRTDEPVIELGAVRIVVIPRGQVGSVLVNGEGHFLLEGRHVINQGRFQLLKISSFTDEYMKAGTRVRIMVPRGKLGLAFEKGEPQLLDPGMVHLKNSDTFSYQGSVDIADQVVTHGSMQIVIVKDGQAGVTYHDGVLELLEPGRHFLREATHVLGGFLSVGQQTLRIAEVTGMSADNVELNFDAAICMRVIDAKKAVTMLTTSMGDIMGEVQRNIQVRAQLALAIIIGNNSLNKKHGATQAAKAQAQEDGDYEKVDESGGTFRQAIHDTFMHSFSTSMREDCGIQVIDMSVEDVRIVNSELATAMASAAVANSGLERTMIESETQRVVAETNAAVALIEAKGKANAMEVMARAEADRIRTTNEALNAACSVAQQQELIKASAGALNSGTTVMLAENTGALATLLSGAQGAALGPKLK